MKILFSITKATEGGAQTHVFQICKQLQEDGHTCAIMAGPDGWLFERAEASGITCYPNPHFKNTFNIFSYFANKRVINRALKDFQPDLISCHSGFAGFMTRLVIRNRIPTIYTAHGWSCAPGVPLLQRILSWIAEVAASRWCEKIICVSSYDKRLAERMRIVRKDKLLCIHNGVPIPEDIPPRKPHLRDIVFVGRLAEPKQPEQLISFARGLTPQERKDIHISIVGDGPKRAHLEAQIKIHELHDCISLLGYMPHKRVQAFLQTMDMLVLPTRKEGLPRSILEALSLGVPVAASGVGGIPEVVDEQVGVLLPQHRAAETLLVYVRRMRENPDAFAHQQQTAIQRIKKHFSFARMYQQTTACYRHVLNG